VGHPHDDVFCSYQAMVFAEAVGFRGPPVHEVGIVVSELVTNVARYAGTGTLTLARLAGTPAGLELTVEDDGPGIHDIPSALADGFSQGQALDQVPPAQRRSLGAGLGAVKRLMHEVSIENRPEGGVRVVARKWLVTR
jgi:serine/threonine-protein kinase RsbT